MKSGHHFGHHFLCGSSELQEYVVKLDISYLFDCQGKNYNQ